MKLISLTVKNFRNLTEQTININKNLNILYGANGQGKTSVLEAIYVLAITKSFRTPDDRVVLQNGKDYFEVLGEFEKESKKKFLLRVYFSPKEGKHVFLNKNKIKTFSSIIGTVPVILLSLEDLELTYGSPAFRRKFIDILISQIDPIYLHSLKEFKKVLQNRNKLLGMIKEGEQSADSLHPWNEQLIEFGSYICSKRIEIIERINQNINQFYGNISQGSETIKLFYQTFFSTSRDISKEEIKNQYSNKLNNNQERDVVYGSTSIGPHRDDIVFQKNGALMKMFGSQGENKTFLISLKFTEAKIMEDFLKEKPLLLLDDIFSELDGNRIKKIVQLLNENENQVFITTTEAKKFITDHTSIGLFKVANGEVTYEA